MSSVGGENGVGLAGWYGDGERGSYLEVVERGAALIE